MAITLTICATVVIVATLAACVLLDRQKNGGGQ